MVQTPIIGLFFLVGPSYVPRFVITRVPYSIQGVTGRRAGSNLVEKLLKACESKLNTPRSVIFIALVPGVGAAAFGAAIGPIFRGLCRSMSRAVDIPFRDFGRFNAAAAFGISGQQRIALYKCDLTTFAYAHPYRLARFVGPRIK